VITKSNTKSPNGYFTKAHGKLKPKEIAVCKREPYYLSILGTTTLRASKITDLSGLSPARE
jgi:hypothetical protein